MKEYYLGVDVGGTNIKYMLTNSLGEVVAKDTMETLLEDGYHQVMGRLSEGIDSLLRKNGIASKDLCYGTLGLPGIINTDRQETIKLSALKWDGFNPAVLLSEKLDIPFRIENDSSLNAYGEFVSSAQNVKSLALITLGTGIGCGIVAESKIFRGARGIGGELGHVIVEKNSNKPCLCGAKGHLESFISAKAMAEYVEETCPKDSLIYAAMKKNNGFKMRLLDKALKENDEYAYEVITYYSEYLAMALSNLCSILSPELILLGGGVSALSQYIIPIIEKVLEESLVVGEQTPIIGRAKLGSYAGAYGACRHSQSLHKGIV